MNAVPWPQPLRAVFVGDLNPYAKGRMRREALEDLGIEVLALSHTATGDPDLGYVPPTVLDRIAWKLGLERDPESANRRLLAAVADVRPHLVWIEKGTMIRPRTLAAIGTGSAAPILASYSEDDMALAHNRTSAWLRGLRYYDVVFTTKRRNLAAEELPALGARRVVAVDKAYDPTSHFPIALDESERRAFEADVGFIGTYERERGEGLLRLAAAGLSVRVWGYGWNAMAERHPNLRIEGRPIVNRPDELRFTKAICATKINLGFLRRLNRDTHTDRSVEIPACGAFLLAERTDDHLRLFREGEEAEFFATDDEMVAKAQRYLADAPARQRIAAAGRERCVRSGYAHSDRMRFMLDALFP